MPKLSNNKWEMFCNQYLSNETLFNGARSYLRVYPDADYDTAKVNASKLLTNANITNRIAELQEIRNKRTNLDQDLVINNLIEDRTDAKQQNQHGVAVKVNELLGKHIGMWNNELTIKGDKDNPIVVANKEIGDAIKEGWE